LQLGNHFLEEAKSNSEFNDAGNLLTKEDVIFDNKVLNELESEKSPKNNNYQFNALDNLEQKYIELETKHKDQQNINSELADKIQQLEFDKEMMYKESENLKKRAYDFEGLLEQSETAAQI